MVSMQTSLRFLRVGQVSFVTGWTCRFPPPLGDPGLAELFPLPPPPPALPFVGSEVSAMTFDPPALLDSPVPPLGLLNPLKRFLTPLPSLPPSRLSFSTPLVIPVSSPTPFEGPPSSSDPEGEWSGKPAEVGTTGWTIRQMLPIKS